MSTTRVAVHRPRALPGSEQGLMPARYSLAVQMLSMAAFTLAFFGWLNETWLFWFDNPIWLNRYTEYAIILLFGIWRIAAERNSYTRRRLIILVTLVTGLWWLIPWLYPVYEPYIGFLWGQPVFPSLHVPGTVTFFLVLALVFLFGRRVICGFNCPCVGIRETVGFPFRNRTLRSGVAWKLRHTKWLFFVYYGGVMVVTQFPPTTWTVGFVGMFYLIVALTYFGSFFVAPLVGNRFYCRYLCPYGATFGLLNHAGFYGIRMDQERCNDCRRCEQVCDMGIPVWQQGRESGEVTALEDCMGCARCVVSCPTDALEIRDVRNRFRPGLRQDASHLLRRPRMEGAERRTPPQRPARERIDWRPVTLEADRQQLRVQAARCLDCGTPGCVAACPLGNRIPEWLEQVAQGDFVRAAGLAHATSSFPEICGTLCPHHRLCEGGCTRAKEPGGAVTIGAIEHSLVEMAVRDGWQPPAPARRNGKRVAVLGAGPAGLACADVLSRAGCEVTVFDRQPVIGGLLSSGVPPFKLDKAVLVRRQAWLEAQGVTFVLDTAVTAEDLRHWQTRFDAIFLGVGAQQPRIPELPGLELEGVHTAIDYLAEVNRVGGGTTLQGRRVVVLGGGDSAIDCARAAIRQGAAKVTVAYRGGAERMRASPAERQAALDEGVQIRFALRPQRFEGRERVEAVVFEEADGHPSRLECDAVILAIGQRPETARWMEELGIETDPQGRILVDERGHTAVKGIFAGGDDTLGPDLVVTAAAAGRRAAEGILQWLHPLKRLRWVAHPRHLPRGAARGEEVRAVGRVMP